MICAYSFCSCFLGGVGEELSAFWYRFSFVEDVFLAKKHVKGLFLVLFESLSIC